MQQFILLLTVLTGIFAVLLGIAKLFATAYSRRPRPIVLTEDDEEANRRYEQVLQRARDAEAQNIKFRGLLSIARQSTGWNGTTDAFHQHLVQMGVISPPTHSPQPLPLEFAGAAQR
jgi:hypothetical protein